MNRRFLLILLAIWLPLQSMAAFAAPLCRHGAEKVQVAIPLDAAQADEALPPCHPGMAMDHGGHTPAAAGHAAHGDHDNHGGAGCDQCQSCHLAFSGALPVRHLALQHPTPGSDALPTPVSHYRSIVLDQPQRPPLPALL